MLWAAQADWVNDITCAKGGYSVPPLVTECKHFDLNIYFLPEQQISVIKAQILKHSQKSKMGHFDLLKQALSMASHSPLKLFVY